MSVRTDPYLYGLDLLPHVSEYHRVRKFESGSSARFYEGMPRGYPEGFMKCLLIVDGRPGGPVALLVGSSYGQVEASQQTL